MEKIASFKVDHMKLLPGLYVSRIDRVNSEEVITFDIRITKPNGEDVMDTGSIHTIEHIGATFLRNNPLWKDKVIYFGPMGCRTGFYLILVNNNYNSNSIVDIMKEMFKYIEAFEGAIPGATKEDCGNYSDMNLVGAKYYAKKYLNEVLDNITNTRLQYPKKEVEDEE